MLSGADRRLLSLYRGKFTGGRALAATSGAATTSGAAAATAAAASVARVSGHRGLAGLVGGEADVGRGDRGLGGTDLRRECGGAEPREDLPGLDVRAEADRDRSNLPGDREVNVGLADRLYRPSRQKGLGYVRPDDGRRTVAGP
jgi:hypothetical protein